MLLFSEFLAEGIEDRGIFKAVFIVGTPGAGKTYTSNKISDGSVSPRIVNTDAAFEFMAKKHGDDLGTADGQTASWKKHGVSVKTITKNQLAGYLNSMLPLMVDGTSSNPSNLLQRNGTLQFFGYDTAMVWVNTDKATALKRIQQRDRKVPEDFLDRVYAEAEENKEFFRSQFDIFIEIDNNDGMLTDDVILDVYRAVGKFYNEDVKNPIGKRHVAKLRQSGDKYLVPSLMDKDEINSRVSIWYKK